MLSYIIIYMYTRMCGTTVSSGQNMSVILVCDTLQQYNGHDVAVTKNVLCITKMKFNNKIYLIYIRHGVYMYNVY